MHGREPALPVPSAGTKRPEASDGGMAVTTEQQDRVLIVRIEREEKRNAVDQEIADGVGAALDRLDDDPELWVGIITGTKTVFSAGMHGRSGVLDA